MWVLWGVVGLAAWSLFSVLLGLFLGREIKWAHASEQEGVPVSDVEETVVAATPPAIEGSAMAPSVATGAGDRLRILVVDDDPALRLLLRTTLQLEGLQVEEAESAEQAAARIAVSSPSAIVLDVGLPAVDGLALCAQLKADPHTSAIPVVLLTGLGGDTELSALASGADGYLSKPFSPLELLNLVQRLTQDVRVPLAPVAPAESQSQLLAYAADLRSLLETALRQQTLLQSAYRQTVAALASALAVKDSGTGAHAQRVVSYASELALELEPRLLDDPSLEYGFLLHDLGKLGVPERILQKPGPLTGSERRLMQSHPVLGSEMLADVPLLEGEGLQVVRSHHERWDGGGYPDQRERETIPLGARVFAVADALDAITSNRPYRPAASWEYALEEIKAQSGGQFDPYVVSALERAEDRLHDAYLRLLGGDTTLPRARVDGEHT